MKFSSSERIGNLIYLIASMLRLRVRQYGICAECGIWFSTVDSSPVPMDRKKVPPTTARNPRELIVLKSRLTFELSISRRIIMSPQQFSASDMMGSTLPYGAFPIAVSVPQTKNLISYTCIYRFTSRHHNTSRSLDFQRILARSLCPGNACRDGAKYLISIT